MTDKSENSEERLTDPTLQNDSDIKKALESLPPPQRERVIKALESLPLPQRESVIEIIEMTQVYQGPVMPPQLMKKLEEVIPGGAERVLRLSEKEQEHRHYIVKRKVITDSWQTKVSLIGGIAAFTVLVLGILYCAAHDYIAGIVTLGGIGAFGVVSHIIRLPKKDQKPDRNEENNKTNKS